MEERDKMRVLFDKMLSAGNSSMARRRVNGDLRADGYTSHEISTARSCLSGSLETLADPSDDVIWYFRDTIEPLQSLSTVKQVEEDHDHLINMNDEKTTIEQGLRYNLQYPVPDKEQEALSRMIKSNLKHLPVSTLAYVLSVVLEKREEMANEDSHHTPE